MRNFNARRLRNGLVLFFLALAVPTGVLIWQAYSQLKWEAFYQYRGMAEELTSRIDATVNDRINTADARNFTDYTFLVISGEPAANFLQRSPLSDYPVLQDLPGVIGYFQVGANGEFSTPLLPPSGTSPATVGINSDEFAQRLQLAREIQQVLADNRLVRSRPEFGSRRAIAAFEEKTAADSIDQPEPVVRQLVTEAEMSASPAPASIVSGSIAMESAGGFVDESFVDKDTIDELAGAPLQQIAADNEVYSQQVFDQLNQPREPLLSSALRARGLESDDTSGEGILEEQRSNIIGKVADLKLDEALQKKSETQERKDSDAQRDGAGHEFFPARAKKRVEQSALPETVLARSQPGQAGLAGLVDLRINTFESEVDPFEFSLLDSGHLVLFRKVWRNGERYIQGLLIDQQHFLRDIVVRAFRSTQLASMSTLAVAYQDDIITTIAGRDDGGYSTRTPAMAGALLYQSHLTAPLGSLQLIFSIDRLPPGPGATVLGWTTIVIAIVFLGGFYALYRTGLSQINLARQQQDFVSAVSHELKTPLTSIRMYGEMLKEGWADEDKRQQYYGYIHDESERLTRLISNVLQLAQITRNEPQFAMRPRQVGEIITQMEAKISSQVENAGFELAFERDPDTDKATISIDDDCFAQIIINLVDNAIKFSRNADRKQIDIRGFTARDGTITFAVRDYGPGVPRDQMKKIFKLFYRSESELTRETVGTGIGLAIVHQLTTAMNGKIDVMNRDPGAEFTLSFPAT